MEGVQWKLQMNPGVQGLKLKWSELAILEKRLRPNDDMPQSFVNWFWEGLWTGVSWCYVAAHAWPHATPCGCFAVFTGSGDACARAFNSRSGVLQKIFRGHKFIINCIQVPKGLLCWVSLLISPLLVPWAAVALLPVTLCWDKMKRHRLKRSPCNFRKTLLRISETL